MNLNLEPFVKEKTLLFTVTSDGYKYFTWNLYKFFETVKPSVPLCILCLDRESYDFFNRIAFLPSRPFFMEGARLEHKTPALFGTTPFKRMNRMKLKALLELSQRQEIETLVYIDSDIALFKDPVPDLQQELEKCPLLFQCDEFKQNDYVCSSVTGCPNACTGVIAMRLTEETRPVFKTLYSIDETWRQAITDQDYINTRLHSIPVVYQTLPRDRYPNGIFLSENRYKTGDAVLLHFNQIVGMEKKRFMKNKGCWLLDVA
jgi:hypothetical protein